MTLTTRSLLFLAALLLVGTSHMPVAAQEATDGRAASSPSATGASLPATPEPWRFMIAAYGWTPMIPVNIDLGPIDATLPENFTTLLGDIEFAAMLDFEVRKGRFGVYAAPIFLFLEDTETVQGPLRSHKITLNEDVLLMDFGLSFEIGKLHDRENPDFAIALEVFAGARWLIDDLKINIDPPDRTFRPEVTFIAPVIGLRTFWDLNKRVNLRIEGDYGGFGVDDLEETYNVLAVVGYRFELWGAAANVFGGYRYLFVHYEKVAELRATVKGPLVGIAFEF